MVDGLAVGSDELASGMVDEQTGGTGNEMESGTVDELADGILDELTCGRVSSSEMGDRLAVGSDELACGMVNELTGGTVEKQVGEIHQVRWLMGWTRVARMSRKAEQ